MINKVQVELALTTNAKWDPGYARPTRFRDLVSAPPGILPSAADSCLQNVIVDLRETEPRNLPEVGADVVYRVAGVEVTGEAIVEYPEVLQALSAGSAWTWVNVSRGKESVLRSLTDGWKRLPEETGVTVRSAALDSVRTWSRIAGDLDLPLRFVYEIDPEELSTVDLLTGLGLLIRGTPPAVFGLDPGRVSGKEQDRLVELVCSGLREAGLRRSGLQLVACPACARTKVNLRRIAAEVAEALGTVEADLCVAVMGCEVNGPGEAKMADVGVACGRGVGLLFRKGEVVRRVPEKEITAALLNEVKNILEERSREQEEAGR
jgi:4-hydroxy-3-methylbut-2-en-1-yl diphosphate synthase IspG/GcpE